MYCFYWATKNLPRHGIFPAGEDNLRASYNFAAGNTEKSWLRLFAAVVFEDNCRKIISALFITGLLCDFQYYKCGFSDAFIIKISSNFFGLTVH
jgi:hypothetical protein